MKKEDILKKFHTEEGIEALKIRLKSFCRLFNEKEFPTGELIILGFGNTQFETKEECLHRIKELSNLVGVAVKVEKITSKMTDGTIKIKEVALCELGE